MVDVGDKGIPERQETSEWVAPGYGARWGNPELRVGLRVPGAQVVRVQRQSMAEDGAARTPLQRSAEGSPSLGLLSALITACT